ncbi:type III-B CRISPR module-associated protein Cmr5 [candidate division KSB1 bacterium]|nr:type III-B CRISPR module-associated protein Cmr5 [candidate division KSB1 bacterium]
MQSREQKRASRAFQLILSGLTTSFPKEEQREKLINEAKRLPQMIHKNGLLASWAFFLAKDDDIHKNNLDYPPKLSDAYAYLLQGLWWHLKNDSPDANHWLSGRCDFFLQRLTVDQAAIDLIGLTEEAVKYAEWIKRAAEALDPGKESL